MADAKKDAHASEGSKLAEKALLWVMIGGLFIGLIRWMGAPTVVIDGERTSPVGTVNYPNRSQATTLPSQLQGTQWTSQGKNAQCAGRPKMQPFTCVSPTTGRTTTCYCD